MTDAADAEAKQASAKRGVGRPRDPGLEQRIKISALETLARYGFSGLTLERVCASAGVPKATFYRRWSTPREAVIEAFIERFEHGLIQETGDLRADLLTFSDRLIDLYADPVLGPCTAQMSTEARFRPEELQLVLDAQQRRRRHNRTAVRQALERAGLDPGLSAQVILTTLNGLAYFGYSTGQPATHDDFARLIDKLLRPA
jgi:AcrR family transcriptional regulator